MKIAIFHELPYGGARRAINEYAGQLKKNHTVDLFIVDDAENIGENNFYSCRYFYQFLPKAWKGNNWKVRIYKDSIELIKLCLLNCRIAGEIDKGRYDIVLVSASRYIESPFIMRFLKTPFVFYIHDPFYRIIYDPIFKISKNLDFIRYNYERLNRTVRKILDKQNISKAKLCLVPSGFIKSLFSKTYKKNCEVVYYGVDTNVFKQSAAKKSIDIFYIGTKEPVDGYLLVKQSIELMKFKPKIKFLMTDQKWISDDKQLADFYQRSKVMLATSYSEGLGLVPLEAMACGTPVVAVNEGGPRETIIDGVTGYLLPRDPQLFAKKLDRVFSHPSEREKMGNNARKAMVRSWSWGSRSNELLRIFKDYLDKTK